MLRYLRRAKEKIIEDIRTEGKKSFRERFFSFQALLPLIIIYGVMFAVIAISIWSDR